MQAKLSLSAIVLTTSILLGSFNSVQACPFSKMTNGVDSSSLTNPPQFNKLDYLRAGGAALAGILGISLFTGSLSAKKAQNPGAEIDSTDSFADIYVSIPVTEKAVATVEETGAEKELIEVG
ncbi:MAG: hypothetical protein SAJ37_17025 [Oscillatoria sp. PMC 1068.18]|nr:hypothetical protein [Oscillatoria sp. PMC 1076.18]MEC4990436.1 hypothetical protein [Oscillatoria sp. PMC 1068.18]